MGILSDMNGILRRTSVKKVVFVFLFLLAIFSSFLEILPTEIVGRFSTRLLTVQNENAVQVIFSWCAGYFLVVALGATVRNLFCYATSRTANTLIKDIQSLAFGKLLSVSLAELPNPDSGYFVNMIQGNSGRLESVFSVALFTLVSDVFDLFWISVFICLMDWKLLLIMGAFIPVLYLLGKQSARWQRTLAVRRISIESRIISKINEAYLNRSVIRVFRGRDRERREFDGYLHQYKAAGDQGDAALSLFYTLEKTIRYIAISLVLFVAAMGIREGKYGAGSLLSIVLYSQKFYSPITNIIRYIQMIQKGMASVDSLQKFLDSRDAGEEENLTVSSEVPFVRIDRAEVFAGGKRILPKTTFTLEEKGLHIITGPSGCGKSTLIKALLGEYPLNAGSIQVGKPVKKGEFFSYASQDTEMFSGTVLENVLYPQTLAEASEEQIGQARELLETLGFGPERWNRDVGEMGSTLSGGEKKRIALARAVLRPSHILLLDEITSNLDGENEEAAVGLIARESRCRCVVLVTHKVHPVFQGREAHFIRMEACEDIEKIS